MEAHKIIVVDDEEIILENIKDYLAGYNLRVFADPVLALKEMEKDYFDIIIVDYKMPNLSGLELLIEGKKNGSYYYGILLTAYADKDILEESINGKLITKVLEKPLRLGVLKRTVDLAIAECKKLKEEREELARLRTFFEHAPRGSAFFNSKIIGLDTSLRDVTGIVAKVADSGANVLISGETGTGKEVIARLVHSMSSRKARPFVKINCGAIPESLIESELFGHCKGSFSGASSDRTGKVALAHEGTLFLDEIAELKLDMQTKLLHVIQDRQIEQIGSNRKIDVDFLLICATNKDLEELMKENRFREDLYYRIDTVPIHIPPLRERLEDLPLLVLHFIDVYSTELNRRNITISPEAMDVCREYSWPGNIRELENVTKRVIILLEENEREISEQDMIHVLPSERGDALVSPIAQLSKRIIDKELDLKGVERLLLEDVLEHFEGSIAEAARNTDISKNRFYAIRNR